MKKTTQILHIISNILFLIIVALIIIGGFVKKDAIRLTIGILVFVAFAIALSHFIISLIGKIKLTLYAIFLFLFLLSGCILTLSVMLDIIALQYVAFIPMIPTALIGFYFEHEDEIKAKMEKQKNSENQKDNNI